MRRMRLFAVLGAVVGLAVAGAIVIVVASGGGDPDEPVSATPVPAGQPRPDSGQYGWLHVARMDLAGRLKVAPLDVSLVEMRDAAWDGCYGVKKPGQGCRELLAAGLIAFFEANGTRYRYHLAGGQVLATDFQPAGTTIEDGFPAPLEIAVDVLALVGEYARQDFALRHQADVTKVTVYHLMHLGRGAGGAELGVERGRAELYTYAMDTGVAWQGPGGFSAFGPPDSTVLEVQALMRVDLAQRLNVPGDSVGIASYREVTWPNGCIGVERPGAVCSQALTDGFLAILRAPDGTLYRYHGIDTRFIAVSFVSGATIGEPMPK